MSAMYWWALGMDMYGKPAICGPFITDDEARTRARDTIQGIIEVRALPTKSMSRAKSMLRFEEAERTGSLDAVRMNIRGF